MKSINHLSFIKSIHLKSTFFLIFFTSNAFFAFSYQNSKSDSLMRVLKLSKEDSNRIDILFQLVEENLYQNPTESVRFGKKALALSKKINYTKKNGVILSKMGVSCVIAGKYKDAEKYFFESLAFAENNKDDLLAARVYGNLAILHGNTGRNDSSLYFLQKSLPYFQKSGSNIDVCKVLFNIGSYNVDLGNLDEGFKYLFKALPIAEKEKSLELIFGINELLGSVFIRKNEYSKAELHLRKALEISPKLNSKYKTSYVLFHLGVLYNNTGRKEEAIKNYEQAANMSREINYPTILTSSLTNIGDIYLEKGQVKKSAPYFLESLEISNRLNFPFGIADGLIKLGNYKGHVGEYDSALKDIEEGINQFKKMGMKEKVASGYQRQSEVYKKMGNFKKSLESYETFTVIKDSIYSESSNNKMKELEIKYETEKKDNKIKAFSQQAKIHQLQNERQQLYLAGSIALAAVLLLIGYLFYRQHTLKARQQNIELEQKLLLAQLNPHFIFNALTAIQHYLFIQPTAEVGRYLSKFAKLMRLILENSREKYITLETEISTLTYYLELQNLRFQNKFDYQIYVDPELDPSTVLIPPMFAQPLIENSLEHGILHRNERGQIHVRFLCKDDMILLEVEDNGIGLQKAQQIKASTESSHKSMASVITQERLETINRRQKRKVKLNIKELMDEQNNVQGTKATFSVPFQLTTNH